MWKQIITLSLVVFIIGCNAAVVKQTLKEQIREQELKELEKVQVRVPENDEEQTTIRIVDPPIHNQFENVIQSGVGHVDEPEPVEAEQQTNEQKAPPQLPNLIEKEDEDEDESKIAITEKVEVRPTKKVTVEEEDKGNEEEDKTENNEAITTEGELDAESETETENEEARKAKQISKNNLFRQGVTCGYHRLVSGQVVSISSPNFGKNKSEYSKGSCCTWKFFGHHCVITTSCPCFDVPESSNCIEAYLKLTDTYSFSERFCGNKKPIGPYKSTTNNLTVRFSSRSHILNETRSSRTESFICYTTCTGLGKAEPVVTNPTNCQSLRFN